MRNHIPMDLNQLVFEVENNFFKNNFQLANNEGINQKKASKLNRFKFIDSILLNQKQDYFNAFLLTLSLYNYYFFSDKKHDNRLNYINKVVKHKDKLIVPYAINWNEELQTYYLWGFNLIEDNRIIKVDKIEFNSLNELKIKNDLNSFNYLFL